MRFTESKIQGVWEVEFERLTDSRGSFERHFCEAEFAKKKIDAKVFQGNLSKNKLRGTLRGLHFQHHPYWEPKTVSCLTGSVHVIVVDLRVESPTYQKWVPYRLSDERAISLHVPSGCAMGWLTLQDNTVLHYYMHADFYAPSGRGLRYNDPQFKFEWPFEPIVISDKDKNFPDFDPRLLESPK